jgi:hypothetical protein
MHARKVICPHHIVKRSFSANWKSLLPRQVGQGVQHRNDWPRRNTHDDSEEQDFGHVVSFRLFAQEFIAEIAEAGSENRAGQFACAACSLHLIRGSVEAPIDPWVMGTAQGGRLVAP